MGAILKQPGVADRVDAVLLADGPHTMYDAPHHVYEPGMEKWVRFAESAMRGEKLFALTHSSIQTVGYPSTTETIGELLARDVGGEGSDADRPVLAGCAPSTRATAAASTWPASRGRRRRITSITSRG